MLVGLSARGGRPGRWVATVLAGGLIWPIGRVILALAGGVSRPDFLWSRAWLRVEVKWNLAVHLEEWWLTFYETLGTTPVEGGGFFLLPRVGSSLEETRGLAKAAAQDYFFSLSQKTPSLEPSWGPWPWIAATLVVGVAALVLAVGWWSTVKENKATTLESQARTTVLENQVQTLTQQQQQLVTALDDQVTTLDDQVLTSKQGFQSVATADQVKWTNLTENVNQLAQRLTTAECSLKDDPLKKKVQLLEQGITNQNQRVARLEGPPDEDCSNFDEIPPYLNMLFWNTQQVNEALVKINELKLRLFGKG